jgi:hypothetical protein
MSAEKAGIANNKVPRIVNFDILIILILIYGVNIMFTLYTFRMNDTN